MWTTGQISKTLRKFRNAIPLRKIKNQYSPLRRRRPHALFAKPSEILKCKFFAPPLGRIKNHDPLGRCRRQALFAKPSEILKCKFFAPLGKIKNHDPLGRRRRQGGVDIKWNGPDI